MKRKRSMPRTRRGRYGGVMVEALIASLIVALSLASMVSLWRFSYNISQTTEDKGVAFNLGRQALETVKQTGFAFTPETGNAPIVHYFDGKERNKDATPSAARYKVSLTVISDLFVAGSNPPQPTVGALRTVTVTVTLVSTGATLYQTTTYLVRAGI